MALVRVLLDNGWEASVDSVYAASAGLTVLDAPAVDQRGRALPAKLPGEPSPPAPPALTSAEYAVTTATSGAGTYTIPTVAAVKLTITGNVTIAFTTPAQGHTVMLRVSGAFTLTFPSSVKWADGVLPTYTSPAVYVFTTLDGGTTWLGSQVGKAFA